MAIQVANPQDGLPEDDDDTFKEDDDSAYNMRELMDMVYTNSDVIFTVPEDQVADLKKGLITRKGKDNVKMQQSGVKPDAAVLTFKVYPHKDDKGKTVKNLMDVRVKLGPRKSVSIIKIHTPSDDL